MTVYDLPANIFSSGGFDLEEYMAINRSRGTEIDVFEVAPRRWSCQYQTRHLLRADAQTWKAWHNSLRGGLNQFYGYDPERPYPKDYSTGFAGQTRHGGGSFDGTGTITSVADAHTITLATLPSTFQFRAGDLIGLVDGSYRAVHEVTADAIASAGAAALTVEPAIITSIFDTSSTFNLVRPKAVMLLVPGTWSAPRDVEGGIIRFQGIQVLV